MSKHLPNFPFLDAVDLQFDVLFKKRVERCHGDVISAVTASLYMAPHCWNEININIYV